MSEIKRDEKEENNLNKNDCDNKSKINLNESLPNLKNLDEYKEYPKLDDVDKKFKDDKMNIKKINNLIVNEILNSNNDGKKDEKINSNLNKDNEEYEKNRYIDQINDNVMANESENLKFRNINRVEESEKSIRNVEEIQNNEIYNDFNKVNFQKNNANYYGENINSSYNDYEMLYPSLEDLELTNKVESRIDKIKHHNALIYTNFKKNEDSNISQEERKFIIKSDIIENNEEVKEEKKFEELNMENFKLLTKDKYNKICVDCSSMNIRYVSINNGVLLCPNCCNIHLEFGNSISYIRKINDIWDDYLLLFIIKGGNKRFIENLKEFKINLNENSSLKYRTNAAKYYRDLLLSEIICEEPPEKPLLINAKQVPDEYYNNNNLNDNEILFFNNFKINYYENDYQFTPNTPDYKYETLNYATNSLSKFKETILLYKESAYDAYQYYEIRENAELISKSLYRNGKIVGNIALNKGLEGLKFIYSNGKNVRFLII